MCGGGTCSARGRAEEPGCQTQDRVCLLVTGECVLPVWEGPTVGLPVPAILPPEHGFRPCTSRTKSTPNREQRLQQPWGPEQHCHLHILPPPWNAGSFLYPLLFLRPVQWSQQQQRPAKLPPSSRYGIQGQGGTRTLEVAVVEHIQCMPTFLSVLSCPSPGRPAVSRVCAVRVLLSQHRLCHLP